jgi:hypothetical protein
VAAETQSLNSRQRKFCELVAAGSTNKAAYFAAYPRCKAERTAETESWRLRRIPAIKAYIAELTQQAQAAAVTSMTLTMAERREFLAKIIRSAPGEINEKDAICQGFKFTRDGREFKMPDKLRAIELDAKLAGELKDQPAAVEGITIIVSQGTLPALQAGYRELQTHGRN